MSAIRARELPVIRDHCEMRASEPIRVLQEAATRHAVVDGVEQISHHVRRERACGEGESEPACAEAGDDADEVERAKRPRRRRAPAPVQSISG